MERAADSAEAVEAEVRAAPEPPATALGAGGPATLRRIAWLQRHAGNGAVARLVRRGAPLQRPMLQREYYEAGSPGQRPGMDVGDKGPAVKLLQHMIGAKESGVFDSQTRRAVDEFQRQQGWEPSGVGPGTWDRLDNHEGSPGNRPNLDLGSRGPGVRLLQRRLGITETAIFDQQTRKAVIAVQSDPENDLLPATGGVGPKTWAKLDEWDAKKTSGSPSAVAVVPSNELFDRLGVIAREPTQAEWAMIRTGRALHYTPAANAPKILTTGGKVIVRPSQGLYRNLTTLSRDPHGYFFLGEPGKVRFGANVAGQGAADSQAVVMIEGADLPANTLFRPLDDVLIVPGEYTGPGIVIPPGGKLPPPVSEPPPMICPADAPPRSAGEVMSSTAKTGALMALVVTSGIVHQKAVERKRDEEGYAPAGENSVAGENVLVRLGRWLVDPFLDSGLPAASRFNVHAWRANVRATAAAKKPGETLLVNWQIHTLSGEVEDEDVRYTKLPDGKWKPDRDKLNDTTKTPDLNAVIGTEMTDSDIVRMLDKSA
jgi:hypothetical protein